MSRLNPTSPNRATNSGRLTLRVLVVAGSGLLALNTIACVGQIAGRNPPRPDTLPGTLGSAGTTSSSTTASGGGPGAGPEAAPFVCDLANPSERVPLRRLTKYEYVNTIRDLLSVEASPSGVVVVEPIVAMAPVEALLAALPDDRPVDNAKLFDASQLRTNEGHALTHFQVAKYIANLVAQDASVYQKMVGSACPDSTVDKVSCVRTLLTSLGTKIFRRPLTTDESTSYLASYKTAAVSTHGDGIRVVVARLLNAPSFIFHMEDQGVPAMAGSSALNLTAYEKAIRLSYALTGTMPDKALIDRAASGALGSQDGFGSEVNRILATPRAHSHIARFFTQWLKIPDAGDLSSLNADYLGAIEPVGLLPKISQETYDFIDHIIWKQGGRLTDLLLSRTAFVSDANLAKIYKVSPSPPANPTVQLNPTHAGLLTRAALLLGLSESTSPIARGVRLRRHILCDPLGEPPANIKVADSELMPLGDETLYSTRQIFEHRTSLPRCQHCHAMINGLGFAFEGYDNLGRARSEELKYSSTGARLAPIPVSTGTVPRVLLDSSAESRDAIELSAMIADTKKAHACLVTQWVEYAVGSAPDTSGASCFRSRIYDALTTNPNGGIAEMFRQTAREIFSAQNPL